MDKSTTCTEIEVKKCPTNKSPKPDDFTDEF